jgi:hypothetical protein
MIRSLYKVIDQNYLREPNETLHSYLKAANFVVLTDYAGMESHKGDALLNLRRSMEIVSKYPRQVVVLKNWYQISRITQRGEKHIRELIIDFDSTNMFHEFCRHLYELDETKPSRALADIERKQLEANKFFTEKSSYAQMVIDSIGMYKGAFPPDQLKQIRLGRYFENRELLKRMMAHIVMLASNMMRKNGYVIKKAQHARSNYIFRWALAGYLLAIKWLAEGGYEQLPVGKMQNDIVDMTYVAYGTYFDGLLSNDNKVNEIYERTQMFLGHRLNLTSR